MNEPWLDVARAHYIREVYKVSIEGGNRSMKYKVFNILYNI